MRGVLFRARRIFVCDRCDLGYRAGSLSGYNPAGKLECAACLYGTDPDTIDRQEHAHA